MRKILCYCLLSCLLCFPTLVTAQEQVIVVVRHAEKMPDSKDPQLTEAGKQRAQHLASRLAQIKFSTAITTQYQRTQATLAPIIAQQKIDHLVVKASAPLEEHISQVSALIKQQPGNVIVAGHSNTAPLIVHALGGPDLAPLAEDEFGKLYILFVSTTGAVSFIEAEYN
ncbi:histidine phosphatase family protein [Shewanella waksmanii]|uniref:histidine phosphatase family protein n=1 Tax=Shewanella waksmanii TaxID=213783 RepID=UPI003734F8C9